MNEEKSKNVMEVIRQVKRQERKVIKEQIEKYLEELIVCEHSYREDLETTEMSIEEREVADKLYDESIERERRTEQIKQFIQIMR